MKPLGTQHLRCCFSIYCLKGQKSNVSMISIQFPYSPRELNQPFKILFVAG